MKAMIFAKSGHPLVLSEIATPSPAPGQVLIRVKACGVCRTDLHIFDGELDRPKLPLVPGHQIVGVIEALGDGVREAAELSGLRVGQRIGVPWLGGTCGHCAFCTSGAENLCDDAIFTGYSTDGGFAQFAVAQAKFCFPIPAHYSDTEAAPLLCAGLIGFRALRMAGNAKRVGFYGFGAAAHLAAQVAVHGQREIYAFTRPGDRESQDFARALGAVWAGDSTQLPPAVLDAALLFAPVGDLVPMALASVRKGGSVICAGIHMSAIPTFAYELLWGERVLRSVANLTHQDGVDFFDLVSQLTLRPQVQTFSLSEANAALQCLRKGELQGAAVLVLDGDE